MNDWFEAEQRIERAQQLSESMRWEEALAELDAAISINPNNAVWHAHRGYILEELERWGDAAAAYETAVKLEPGDREVATSLGVALARLGRYGRALEIFAELARLYPDYEPAYCHRINIYGKLGRHEQAEEMFYRAQELNDACPHCFNFIGSSLLARGETDRALFCWERVLELEPEYADVQRSIAQAYRARGELELARDYYLRDLREDPGNLDLLLELAELMIEADDVAAASAKLDQIIELDPHHIEAHFTLGTVRLRNHQPREALACFEEIQSIVAGEPELPSYRFRFALALFQLGRFADACDHLRTAVAGTPDVPVWMLLGDCLLALGKPARAGDAFRRVLAIDADQPIAHHKLAVCHVREGRYECGLEHCDQTLRLRADHVPAMYTAALACLNLGRWRQARTYLRQARLRDPGNAAVKDLAQGAWRFRLRHVRRRLSALFRWRVFDRR